MASSDADGSESEEGGGSSVEESEENGIEDGWVSGQARTADSRDDTQIALQNVLANLRGLRPFFAVR